MGFSPNGVLKASLWLQAAALLVSTSLLADAGAWIGAIVTAIGFSFVIVGIGAAHKKSLGYLYCYATLVGVWELLAIVHTLILCGLIVLPEELIEPSLIVGQKIVDNANDPSQIVIPSLFAVQGGSWCISLVTLVCLRVAVQDPALGFEIQDPKQKCMGMVGGAKGAYSLESALRGARNRHPENSPRSSGRLSQKFFGFGPSSSVAPAPEEDLFGEPSMGRRISAIDDSDIDRAKEYDSQIQKYKSWTGTEKRISLDSNVIYYPSHQRISQVTVTFRDENNLEQGGVASPSRPIEAKTVFINSHNYGLDELEFDQPGESLSELIFKAVSPISAEPTNEAIRSMPSKTVDRVRMSDDSEERSETETKAESPTLSTTTTLQQDYAIVDESIADLQGPQSSLPISVDLSTHQIVQMEKLQKQRQQYLPAWQTMMRLDHEEDEVEEAGNAGEGRIRHPPPLSASSYNPPIVIPARRSSINDCSQLSTEDSGFHVNGDVPDQETATVPASSQARSPKPSLASLPLQYWRSRSSNTGSEDVASASSPSTPTSSSPFSLVNTFAKKIKQGTVALATPPTPMPIPQIVLHPDEEDGEPARVLSERDIEYLSTMPPAPLRPLVPQWDEEDPGDDEEDYYDHDGNEGYDYEDYHHPVEEDYDDHDQDDSDYNVQDEAEVQRYHQQRQLRYQKQLDQLHQLQEAEADDIVESQLEVQEEFNKDERGTKAEYDPYALDVPINLEIDLQGLEQ
ncbi:hypothetical protein EMPS_01352 [Entomortierella parvispora]|uniref:Uncharacterized protein n=1 Tax=Entomortierella parvispora TaxID=205924 RepID=A0A9P3H2P0_9FUNG|nr:hypothetical protein EMPS_01352 [Entomortierella parvispora]